jgi:hypothetical protein
MSDYLKNGNIIQWVNISEVNQPRSDGKRICIIHKRRPDMIIQIIGLHTEADLNIENMVNKSKKIMAYHHAGCDRVLWTRSCPKR